MEPTPYLSLVIPCYNEEENVPTLLARVEGALRQTGRTFEVVIVDDGSTDSTPRLLADAMKVSPWLRVIRMARNGGQSAAFEAGFEAARGEVIATIDVTQADARLGLEGGEVVEIGDPWQADDGDLDGVPSV